MYPSIQNNMATVKVQNSSHAPPGRIERWPRLNKVTPLQWGYQIIPPTLRRIKTDFVIILNFVRMSPDGFRMGARDCC